MESSSNSLVLWFPHHRRPNLLNWFALIALLVRLLLLMARCTWGATVGMVLLTLAIQRASPVKSSNAAISTSG